MDNKTSNIVAESEPNGMEKKLEGEVNPVAMVTMEEAAGMSLTPEQRAAIEKLTSGHTRVEAASAAGVSRMTVYRWMNHDPVFQAAYNAWHRDVLNTAQGQLLSATREAVSAVVGAIRRGDAKLAWKLLESQGITARPKVGSTDVVELQRREGMEKRRKEIAERRERNKIKNDELMSMDGL